MDKYSVPTSQRTQFNCTRKASSTEAESHRDRLANCAGAMQSFGEQKELPVGVRKAYIAFAQPVTFLAVIAC